MTWVMLALLAGIFWWGPPWGRSRRWRGHRQGRELPAAELPQDLLLRLESVDRLEARVAELESRLDFTERLLSERRRQDQPASA